MEDLPSEILYMFVAKMELRDALAIRATSKDLASRVLSLVSELYSNTRARLPLNIVRSMSSLRRTRGILVSLDHDRETRLLPKGLADTTIEIKGGLIWSLLSRRRWNLSDARIRIVYEDEVLIVDRGLVLRWRRGDDPRIGKVRPELPPCSWEVEPDDKSGIVLHPRAQEFFLVSELGLVDPKRPPGPKNPRLQRSLHLLSAYYNERTIATLFAIYMHLAPNREKASKDLERYFGVKLEEGRVGVNIPCDRVFLFSSVTSAGDIIDSRIPKRHCDEASIECIGDVYLPRRDFYRSDGTKVHHNRTTASPSGFSSDLGIDVFWDIAGEGSGGFWSPEY